MCIHPYWVPVPVGCVRLFGTYIDAIYSTFVGGGEDQADGHEVGVHDGLEGAVLRGAAAVLDSLQYITTVWH